LREAFYVRNKIRIVLDPCILRELGCGSKRACRRCAAPGWFQRAKLVARHSDAGTGNCHSASQHSYAASANSYATGRHGNAADKSSVGIGSPAERDDFGRHTALNHIPQQSGNNSERNSLCDAGNAERLDSECRVVESRFDEFRFDEFRFVKFGIERSGHIQSGLIAFDAKPGK